MDNNILLWSTFILPWLTLFFMKKDEIKRFLEVAWFTTVMNVLLYDFGITLKFWNIKQNAYPFFEIPPFFFGLYPVIAIWILKLSYENFWKYIALNAVADAIFAYVFLPWLVSRGVHGYVNYLAVLLIALSQAIIVYVYQMLHEGELIQSIKT